MQLCNYSQNPWSNLFYSAKLHTRGFMYIRLYDTRSKAESERSPDDASARTFPVLGFDFGRWLNARFVSSL